MKKPAPIGLLLLSLLLACFSCGEAESPPRDVSIVLTEVNAGAYVRQGADSGQQPAFVRLTLRGPSGMRFEEFEYAAESAALSGLQAGAWELRADGIRANGELGWASPKTTLRITGGESITFSIKLDPITE